MTTMTNNHVNNDKNKVSPACWAFLTRQLLGLAGGRCKDLQKYFSHKHCHIMIASVPLLIVKMTIHPHDQILA